MASGNFHAVLGVPMAFGRGFVADDDRMTNACAVISYRYWTQRFASDPDVLGGTLYVNGNPTTLIGVTGREFFGISPGRPVDITISMFSQHGTTGSASPLLDDCALAFRRSEPKLL
jgi:hypothetical protein